jgi:hypothetical protein
MLLDLERCRDKRQPAAMDDPLYGIRDNVSREPDGLSPG